MEGYTGLGNETILLRALEPGDLDTAYRWENDARLWRMGETSAPLSRQQLWEYISNYDADIFAARQLRLVIELRTTGESIGALDLYDFDPVNSRSGVGILIEGSHRGKGYGLAALEIAAEYCRRRLSMHQLWAIVAADNAASRSLFERAGYRTSGRLQSWIREANAYTDALVYQKML